MKIVRNLTHSFSEKPIVLTIGNFDGVHLGHRAVLDYVKSVAVKENRPWAVITFENHPSEVLRPEKRVPLLCTLPHRIRLLEQQGADFLLLLPFTAELSQLTAEEFLQNIYARQPFTHLILGHDATLGKNRHGDSKHLKAFADTAHFSVEYLKPFVFESTIVSSSVIRACIQQGELAKASLLLGRNYSMYGTVIKGLSKGAPLGFPTANIDVSGLCLPPLGVYAVHLIHKGNVMEGIANLGIAPTIRNDTQPLLEVHLFDQSQNLYGEEVEVVFSGFIRPEIKFGNVDQLKDQIKQDIERAKDILREP
jgi:riboflavin kinase / FMN adenylyltransferase